MIFKPLSAGFATSSALFGTEQVNASCLVTVFLCLIAPETLPDLPWHAFAKLVSLLAPAKARKAEFG